MGQRETEPIGQLLLNRGWITRQQLTAALIRQKELGGRLGTALLEMSVISEDLLGKTLAEQSGLPAADVDELRDIDQSVIEMLPANVALRHSAVPFRRGRGRVSLAVVDEPDIPTLDELAFVLGRRVVIHVANEARVLDALERHYGGDCPMRFKQLLGRLDQAREQPAQASSRPAAPEPETSPPAKLESRPAAADDQREPAPEAPLEAAPEPRVPLPPRPTSVPLSADEKKALNDRKGEDRIQQLSLEGVQRALQAAHRADDIGVALVGFLSQEFLRLLLFRVGQGQVRGWMGRSPSLDEYRFRNWAVGFDEPSVFLNLRQGAEFFLGKLPAMPSHERLLRCWRGSLDTECAVFPVKVRDRLVCAIYGDRDTLGLVGLDVPAIQRLTAKAAIAFEMLLMQRKLRS